MSGEYVRTIWVRLVMATEPDRDELRYSVR